jgi:lysophospholipase L1-like esterase
MYDAENLIKVRVCSECGEVENEIAGPADVSLPAYNDADHGTVTVVFDFNNGGPKTAIHVPKGSAIDMDDVLYPFDFLFGAAHYIFNCWTTDPEGVYPSNPDGAIVKEDTTYYIRWSLETTSTYYDPAYKIETTEGGPYNAGKLNAGKVIFYGSSNFRMWSTLITDMAPEIPALNHGISGCNDTHLLAYLNRLVLSYRPKITVINCSTNDLLTLTNEQIKLNKEELVRIIHETDPEMVILFTSHMPLPAYKGTENQDRMEELNVWVEDFCSTHDNVEYIDVFTPVIDLPGEYFNDSLHFSALGQELYGKLLKDKLLEMVDEYGISFDDAGMPPEAADDTDEPEDTETPPEDVETPPEDETDPVVMRSNQTITVDGEAVEFDVYNIDGNNYFKLRDIAMTLDGTDSTFAVGYDSATRTITCTSGEAYEANGSELVIGEDLSATAVRSNQPLYVDGELSTIKAYNLGGNNFFQLRELGAALGFGVDYDSATRTVIIDSAA